ncbi:MAG: HAD-IB family phosphatase [Nitrososphaerales archaeon]|nr:HAD-IB family phosphatase [Nitrososphaerales archaeon]
MTEHGLRLASFDMDGTVLEEDSSWVALHKFFGTSHMGKESLKLYTEGKIDYQEFMRRDIAAWPKGVTQAEVEAILSGYKVRREAPATLRELRRRGIELALVTSGIDILAKKVAEELGIKHWVANGLRFDGQGRILPEGIPRVDPTRKDVAYLAMLRSLRIPREATIAVGDTIYDLAFLRTARLGFMLAHTTRVDDPKIIHIEKLSDIFEHI